MKTIYLSLAFMCMVLTQFAQSSGEIQYGQISSEALSNSLIGEPVTQPYVVYLPPLYQTNTLKRYPVIYFLMGYEDTIAAYVKGSIGGFRLENTMNSAITNGQTKEIIMVVVNSYNKLEGSFFQNSPVTGNWEDFVVNEMVPYMDANYRTLAHAPARALIGLSMGGYGALNLSMKHPDVFSIGIGLCPGLAAPGGMAKTSLFDNTSTIRSIISIIDSYKNLSREEAHQRYMNSLSGLRSGDWVIPFSLAYASAFAPDTNANAPYIKYPYSIDEQNKLVRDDEIYKLYEAGFGNLESKVLAYKDNLNQLRGYAIDYATNDYFTWIIEGSEYYDQLLSQEGINHKVWTNTGNHGGSLGSDMLQFFMPYCDSLLSFDSLNLSSENNIVSFKVSGLSGDPVINAEDRTITLTFRANANLKNLKPTVVISAGANIEPSVYSAIDFSGSEITYKVTSENGSHSDTWRIINATSAVDENAEKSGFLIYPNPANGSFMVESVNENLQSITLFNLLGYVMQSNSFNGNKISIDTNQMEPGIYFVSVKTAHSECVRKIVLE